MQRTKRPTKLKIIFEKKALIITIFGNACEYVIVKDSGERATLQKWKTLYAISVFLRKEDVRVGDPFPITKKTTLRKIYLNFIFYCESEIRG